MSKHKEKDSEQITTERPELDLEKYKILSNVLEDEEIICQLNDLPRSMPYLGELEYNIFKTILALVTSQDPVEAGCLYKLDVKDFMQKFNYSGNDTPKQIKHSLERLQDRKLRADLFKDGVKGSISSPLIAGVKYMDGEGFALVEVPIFIRQMVSNIVRSDGYFSLVKLETFSKLKGPNVKRLYEILKAEEYRGKYVLPADELKTMMDLDDSYFGRNSDFYNKTIVPAVARINEESDIVCESKSAGSGSKMKIMFSKIKSKENLEKEKMAKAGLRLTDDPRNIFIWENLYIKASEDDNYLRLLAKADSVATPLGKSRKYYLHYYLCYANNLSKSPQRPYWYVSDLLENDYMKILYNECPNIGS